MTDQEKRSRHALDDLLQVSVEIEQLLFEMPGEKKEPLRQVLQQRCTKRMEQCRNAISAWQQLGPLEREDRFERTREAVRGALEKVEGDISRAKGSREKLNQALRELDDPVTLEMAESQQSTLMAWVEQVVEGARAGQLKLIPYIQQRRLLIAQEGGSSIPQPPEWLPCNQGTDRIKIIPNAWQMIGPEGQQLLIAAAAEQEKRQEIRAGAEALEP